MSRKVLMVTAEFAPSNTAATNRTRFFSKHLPEFDWQPIVMTIRRQDICGPIDETLETLGTAGLRVERVPLGRFCLGLVKDLGLRSYAPFKNAIVSLCQKEKIELLFIPGPPWFSFLLGPAIQKEFGIPFVIDYIDPWVSEDEAMRPIWTKRGLFQRWALHSEKKVIHPAGAVTAVSKGILESLKRRYPDWNPSKSDWMPYGFDETDFDVVMQKSIKPRDFSSDGCVHLCFTGAIQPTSGPLLRIVLRALSQIKSEERVTFDKIRLHFYGTSNLTWGNKLYQVVPLAKQFGVDEILSEIPERVPYFESLAIQKHASINLVMGSTQPFYHASKLYSCLMAKRPLLALCHEQSSIAQVLKSVHGSRCLTFGDAIDEEALSRQFQEALTQMIRDGLEALKPDEKRIQEYSARYSTQKLASVFNRVAMEHRAR